MQYYKFKIITLISYWGGARSLGRSVDAGVAVARARSPATTRARPHSTVFITTSIAKMECLRAYTTPPPLPRPTTHYCPPSLHLPSLHSAPLHFRINNFTKCNQLNLSTTLQLLPFVLKYRKRCVCVWVCVCLHVCLC